MGGSISGTERLNDLPSSNTRLSCKSIRTTAIADSEGGGYYSAVNMISPAHSAKAMSYTFNCSLNVERRPFGARACERATTLSGIAAPLLIKSTFEIKNANVFNGR
jgi:hypothetical protein